MPKFETFSEKFGTAGRPPGWQAPRPVGQITKAEIVDLIGDFVVGLLREPFPAGQAVARVGGADELVTVLSQLEAAIQRAIASKASKVRRSYGPKSVRQSSPSSS